LKVFIDANILIYLNVPLPEEEARIIEEFWLSLVKQHELYTNALVLDETIYISMKKYGVPPMETIELIDRAVLPYVDVLSLGLEEYLLSRRFMTQYGLKPSDALHVATILANRLDAIASEDRDFNRTGIKRIWIDGEDI